MIEKLQTWQRPLPNNPIVVETIGMDNQSLFCKINELVDAVNVLQAQVAILEEHAHPTAKTEPADPYAEQRKWIGKLCKFWDYDDEKKWFSILELIDKNSPYSYCASGDWWYKHCEPVKPDDDIIYKGE